MSEKQQVSDVARPSPPPSQVPPPPLQDDFPDGGRAAWLMVFGGWCGVFCTLGLLNCGGVFEDYYTTGPLIKYGESATSWIISVQSWSMNFSSIVFGLLYDKYGSKPLLLCATPLYVFGLMMVSLGTQYWHFFLAQSICVGISGGAIFTTCISTVPSWFFKRRATAYGIMLSGAGLGGTVVPIMMARLLDSVGFAWMIRAVALLYLALLPFTILLTKPRLPPSRRPFMLHDYLSGFKNHAYVYIMIASFMFYWGMFLPLNYIVLEAKAQGMSPKIVPYLVPIINAFSVLGRIGPGILADKVGRFNTVIVLTGFSALFALALWIPGRTEAAIIAFALFFGFFSGGFISLAPALIAQVSDIQEIGSRTGAVYAIQSLATLTGSPIAGALVEAMGGRYLGLQLFCGLSLILSCAALLAARTVVVGFAFSKI